MEEMILKYGKEVALFALCVYLIWSDRQERKADREFIKGLVEKKENVK